MGQSFWRSVEYFFTGNYTADNDNNTIVAIGFGGVINAYGGDDHITVGSIGATVNTGSGDDQVVGGAAYLQVNDSSGDLQVYGAAGYADINKSDNGNMTFGGAAGGVTMDHTGDSGDLTYGGAALYNGLTRQGLTGNVSFSGAGGYNNINHQTNQGNLSFAGIGGGNNLQRSNFNQYQGSTGNVDFAGAGAANIVNSQVESGNIHFSGAGADNHIVRQGKVGDIVVAGAGLSNRVERTRQANDQYSQTRGNISFAGVGGYNSLYSDVAHGDIRFNGAGAANIITRKGLNNNIQGKTDVDLANANDIILKSATLNGDWINTAINVDAVKSEVEENTFLFVTLEDGFTKINKVTLSNDPQTGKLTYHASSWNTRASVIDTLATTRISEQDGFTRVDNDVAYTLSQLKFEHQQTLQVFATEAQLHENEWVTYSDGVAVEAGDVTLNDAKLGGVAINEDGVKFEIEGIKSNVKDNTFIYARFFGSYTKIVTVELANHSDSGALQYKTTSWYKVGDHTDNIANTDISANTGYSTMGEGGYVLTDLNYSVHAIRSNALQVTTLSNNRNSDLITPTNIDNQESSGDVHFNGAGGGNIIKSNVTRGHVYFNGAGIANVIEHSSDYGNTVFNGVGAANVIVKSGLEGDLTFRGAGLANVLVHQSQQGEMDVYAAGAVNVSVRIGDGAYLAHLLAYGNISVQQGNGDSRVVMFGGYNTHTQIGNGNANYVAAGGFNIITQVGNGNVNGVLAGGANVLSKIGNGDVNVAMLGGLNVLTQIGDDSENSDMVAVTLGGANVITKKGRGNVTAVMAGGANVLTQVGDGNTTGVMLGGYNILTKVGNGTTTGVMFGIGNVLTHVGNGQTLGVMGATGNIFTKVGDGTSIAAMVGAANIFTHVGQGNAWALMGGMGNIFTKVGDGNALALMVAATNVYTHVGEGDSVAIMIAAGNIATKVGNGDMIAAMVGNVNVLTQIGDGNTFAAMIGEANILTKVGNQLSAALMVGKANIYSHVGDGTSIGLFAGTLNVMTKVGDGTTIAAMFGQANIITHVGDGITGVLALGRANIVTKVGDDFMGVVAAADLNVVTHVGDGTTAALLLGKGNILTKVGEGTTVGLLISEYGNIMTHVDDGTTIGFAKGKANIITKVGDGLGINVAWGEANILTHVGDGDRYNFAKGKANIITKIGDGQEVAVVQGEANIVTHVGDGDDYTGAWGKANIITKVGDGSNVVLAKGNANIVTQVGNGDSYNALWGKANVVTKVGDGIQVTAAKADANIVTTVGDGLSVTATHGDLNINTKIGDGVSVNVAWGKLNVTTKVGDGLNVAVMKGKANVNVHVGDGLGINASYAQNNIAIKVGNGDFYSLAVATSNTKSDKLSSLFDSIKQTVLGVGGSQAINYLVQGDEGNTSGSRAGRGAINLTEISSIDGFNVDQIGEVDSNLADSLDGSVSSTEAPDTEQINSDLAVDDNAEQQKAQLQQELAAQASQNPNLIINGDFEQGDTGWSSTHGVEADYSADAYGLLTENHGNIVSELATSRNTSIYQQLDNLSAGETLELSFDFARRAGIADSKGIEVLFNGEVVFAHSNGTTAWTQQSLTLTATAGTNQLEFRGIGVENGGGYVIDNVSAHSTLVAQEITTPQTPNLITNGDFEQGDTGWSSTHGVEAANSANTYGLTNENHGNIVSELATSRNTSIYQQLDNLSAGETLELSFDFARRASIQDSKGIEVLFNGEVVFSHSNGTTAWTQQSLTLTATAGTNQLEFRGIGVDDGGGYVIDNVSAHSTTVSQDILVSPLTPPADVADNANQDQAANNALSDKERAEADKQRLEAERDQQLATVEQTTTQFEATDQQALNNNGQSQADAIADEASEITNELTAKAQGLAVLNEHATYQGPSGENWSNQFGGGLLDNIQSQLDQAKTTATEQTSSAQQNIAENNSNSQETLAKSEKAYADGQQHQADAEVQIASASANAQYRVDEATVTQANANQAQSAATQGVVTAQANADQATQAANTKVNQAQQEANAAKQDQNTQASGQAATTGSGLTGAAFSGNSEHVATPEASETAAAITAQPEMQTEQLSDEEQQALTDATAAINRLQINAGIRAGNTASVLTNLSQDNDNLSAEAIADSPTSPVNSANTVVLSGVDLQSLGQHFDAPSRELFTVSDLPDRAILLAQANVIAKPIGKSYREILAQLDNVHQTAGNAQVLAQFTLNNLITNYIEKHPDSGRNPAFRQLQAQLEQVLFSDQLSVIKSDISDIAKSQPELAARIYATAQAEVQGEHPGLTDFMVTWAKQDPYLAFKQGYAGQTPTDLGFEAKYHIELGQYAGDIKPWIAQAQAQGLLSKAVLDENSGTLHLGYSYQEMQDLSSAESVQLSFYFIKEAAKAASKSGLETPEDTLLRQFSSQAQIKQIEQLRLDNIEAIYHASHQTDITQWDLNYGGDALTALNTQLGQIETIEGQVRQLLSDKKGLLIGETHGSDVNGLRFVNEQMSLLKAQGVSVIALEHLRADLAQPLLDQYFSGGIMSPELSLMIKTKHLELSLFENARANNIRIVALDNNSTARPNISGTEHGLMYRAGAANSVAVNILSDLPEGDKFVAIYGNAHLRSHQGIESPLAGITHQLNLPALRVTQNNRFIVQADELDQRKVYDDIATNNRINFSNSQVENSATVLHQNKTMGELALKVFGDKRDAADYTQGDKYQHVDPLAMVEFGFTNDVRTGSTTLKNIDDYRITVDQNNNIIYANSGKLVHTPTHDGFEPMMEDDIVKYTMNSQGDIYVFGNVIAGYRSEIKHSQGAVKNVIAAGEIQVNNGKLVLINEESGHFQPSKRVGFVEQELTDRGLTGDNYRIDTRTTVSDAVRIAVTDLRLIQASAQSYKLQPVVDAATDGYKTLYNTNIDLKRYIDALKPVADKSGIAGREFNVRKTNEFLTGYQQGHAQNIVTGFNDTMKVKQLVNLLVTGNFNSEQKGALAWEIENRLLHSILKPQVENINKLFDKVLNKGATDHNATKIYLPQLLLTNLWNDGAGGRCDPLAKLVLVAKQLESNGQADVAAKLMEKLYSTAAVLNNPSSYSEQERNNANKVLRFIMQIHTKNPMYDTRVQVWQQKLDGATLQDVVTRITDPSANGKPVLLELDAPGHAMSAWAKGSGDERRFGFYDSNAGVIEFSSAQKFNDYMVGYFGKKGLNKGKSYGLTTNNAGQLAFDRVVVIDGQALAGYKTQSSAALAKTSFVEFLDLPVFEASAVNNKTAVATLTQNREMGELAETVFGGNRDRTDYTQGDKYQHVDPLAMVEFGFANDVRTGTKQLKNIDDYRITIDHNNNVIYANSGKLVHTPVHDGFEPMSEDDIVKYTMNSDGDIYVFGNVIPGNRSEIKHSQGAVKNVIAAGEIQVNNGKLVLINEESGHFQPSKRAGFVEQELRDRGLHGNDHRIDIRETASNHVRIDVTDLRLIQASVDSYKLNPNQALQHLANQPLHNKNVEQWTELQVRVNTEQSDSRFDAQVIIQLENDDVARRAAASLASKHPDSSVVVQLDAQGNYRVVYGDPAQLAGNIRWQVVGHGRDQDQSTVNTQLAGYSAQELAAQLARFKNDFGQYDSVSSTPAHISIVGCSLVGFDNNDAFARQFITQLDQQGIRSDVSARRSDVAVDDNGRKHTINEQGQYQHQLAENKLVLSWNEQGEIVAQTNAILNSVAIDDIDITKIGLTDVDTQVRGTIADTERAAAPVKRKANVDISSDSDSQLSYSGNIQVNVGDGEFTAVNWGSSNIAVKVGTGGFKSLAFGDNNIMVHVGDGDSKHSFDIAGYQALEGAQMFIGTRNISFNMGRSNDLIVMMEKSIPTPPLVNPFDGAATISGALQKIANSGKEQDWYQSQAQQWTLAGAKKYANDMSSLDQTSSVNYSTLTDLDGHHDRSSRGLKGDIEATLNKQFNQWLGGDGGGPDASKMSRADKFRQANEKLAFNFSVGGQGADIQITTGNWNFMFGDNVQSILDTNLGSLFGLMTQQFSATGQAKTTFTYNPQDLPRQLQNRLLGQLAGVGADTTLGDIFGVDYTAQGHIVSRDGAAVDGVAILKDMVAIVGEFSGDQLQNFVDPAKLLDSLKSSISLGADGLTSFAQTHGMAQDPNKDQAADGTPIATTAATTSTTAATAATTSAKEDRAFGFGSLNLPNIFATIFSSKKQGEMAALVTNLKENLTKDLLNMKEQTFDFLSNSGHLQDDGDMNVSLGNYNFNWGGDGKDLGAYLGDNNNFWGGRGDDVFYATGTSNIFTGGQGNDTGVLMGRENMMFGGDGDDVAVVAGRTNNVFMGDGNDQSFVFGEGGNIDAGTGQDYVVTTGNFNQINSGSGQDYTVTIGNNNQNDLGEGNDFANIFGNYNRLDGNEGDDTVKLMGYYAAINGNDGDDQFITTAISKFSTIDGGEGNDVMFLGGYQNNFTGGTGVDTYVINSAIVENVVNDISADDLISFSDIKWQNLWFERHGNDLRISILRDDEATTEQAKFESIGNVTFSDYFNGNRAKIVTSELAIKDDQAQQITTLNHSAVDALVQAMSGFAPTAGDSGFMDNLNSSARIAITSAWSDTSKGTTNIV